MRDDIRQKLEENRISAEKVRDLTATVSRLQPLQAEVTSLKSRLEEHERSTIPGLRTDLRDAKQAYDDLSRRVRELEALVTDLRQYEHQLKQLKMEHDR